MCISTRSTQWRKGKSLQSEFVQINDMFNEKVSACANVETEFIGRELMKFFSFPFEKKYFESLLWLESIDQISSLHTNYDNHHSVFFVRQFDRRSQDKSSLFTLQTNLSILQNFSSSFVRQVFLAAATSFNYFTQIPKKLLSLLRRELLQKSLCLINFNSTFDFIIVEIQIKIFFVE